MATYDDAIRACSRLTCWLQNGRHSASFDVFGNHRQTFLSPSLEVTEEVTLKPGVIYNLDGLFLDKSLRDNAAWKKKSVSLHITKKLSHPVFSGGVQIQKS